MASFKSSHESRRVRIEALRDLRDNKYSTTAYIQEGITVQPTYPQSNGKYDRNPNYMEVWSHYDLPWTDGNSADAVLTEALAFLRERCE